MHRIKFFLAAALVVNCAAQTPATQQTPKKPLSPTEMALEQAKHPSAPDVHTTAPEMDELEATKLENFNLKRVLITNNKQKVEEESSDLNKEVQQFVIKIEHDHPGFTLNFQTNKLVLKPTMPVPQPEVKKPAVDATGTPIKK